LPRGTCFSPFPPTCSSFPFCISPLRIGVTGGLDPPSPPAFRASVPRKSPDSSPPISALLFLWGWVSRPISQATLLSPLPQRQCLSPFAPDASLVASVFLFPKLSLPLFKGKFFVCAVDFPPLWSAGLDFFFKLSHPSFL